MRKMKVSRKFLWNFSKLKIMLAFGLSMVLMLSTSLYANANSADGQQKKTVTGTVVDAEDNVPVIGATVSVQGTTNGTVTDIDGKFSLSVDASDVLVISFIGYKNQLIPVEDQTTINISLEQDVTDLDEVVVIGYGVQKKKLVTGATVAVKGEALAKLSTTSSLTALQGQTPGVQLTQNNGEPGSGYKITIRGLGTTGNASPLYVIDGVAGGDINSLNPSDIESVDILKDAASSAIYGARAANGVVLVTTKQGSAGKIQVSYDGYYGIQRIYKKPSLLNAQEYITFLDEYDFGVSSSQKDWESLMSPELYSSIMDGSFKGTNWFDEMANDEAPTQNHAVNITGGSDVSNFSMGFSYTAQDGIFGADYASDYERYTARINSEHVIYRNDNDLDIIKFGENLNFNRVTNNGIGKGNIYWNDVHNAMVASPLIPAYNEDGSFYSYTDRVADGNIINSSLGNPYIEMASTSRGLNLSNSYGLNATAYLVIQPIKGLNLRSQFNYRQNSNSYRSFSQPYSSSSTSSSTNYSVSQSASTGHSYTFENTLSYILPELSGHNINVLVGQSIESHGYGESVNASNSIAADDALSTLQGFDYAFLTNVANNTSNVSIGGSPWGEGRLLSFFGRASWDYQEKYMATVTMRADGSSNFAPDHRWGYFPSVSAGWVVSSEDFMESTSSWMDYFKLRASWGQNGNSAISPFQYLATVSFDVYNVYKFSDDVTATTSVTSPATGGYADILPNPDITWETSEQLDFGFDAHFLDSRLNLTFDWYKKTTKDWLVVAPTLAIYGTSAPYINGGDVENTGYEVSLGWNDRINSDFSYGVNFNLSYNKNEVTRIANGEGIIHGSSNVLSQGTDEMYRAQEGYPIGYFYGFKTAGVFQNQQEIEDYMAAGNPVLSDVQPGDLIWVDTNNDGTINNDDRTMIGDPHPDYNIGLNFNMSYKGFDFAVSTYGALGQQIAKSYRSFVDSYWQNYTTDVFQRWHGEGTSNTFPRISAGSHTNNQWISDRYIEDGDYLKIQNVTFGYDFKKLLPSVPLSQMRLYVAVNNLYTFTNYGGLDPEIGYGAEQSWVQGIDLGYYPSPRTFLMGVNLKF
ncbi:TonB-dependent receptor [uncultured Draconibacterium sp.]|uniref:SusC/RagA family TonB-linked outer membrane protein n=1 Tax=uncultured Draconibacterium sp. TaxID=1573823 RepID=UPI0025FA6725|nr:TonB-dependent receptor [uncultured Draconibacterium sp.]